jgi:hypothetical protein
MQKVWSKIKNVVFSLLMAVVMFAGVGFIARMQIDMTQQLPAAIAQALARTFIFAAVAGMLMSHGFSYMIGIVEDLFPETISPEIEQNAISES